MDLTNAKRVNKFIAECGVCSRRDADELVSKGLITINGKLATPGSMVQENDTVMYNKKCIKPALQKTVLAYYKPIGVTCTERDPHAKRTITKEVNYSKRLTYAGRLDKDSEGLILLTDDGDLIQSMMKASMKHEKEYIVKVNKEITPEFIQTMGQGIFLEELQRKTRACQVEYVGKFTFRITLTEGLNREIRRMTETLGYKVTALKRLRVVNILLGTLKPGEYRELSVDEMNELYREVGLK